MPSKPPPYPPPRPSHYLNFSSAHGRCTTGVRRGGLGRPQPTCCLYLQVIRPSQVLSDVMYAQWWEICPTSAELLGRRTRSFHGLGSSTRSSTFIARVHYSCTSVYLISWTVYLRYLLCTRHYDVMVGCLFTGQGKKGIASGNLVTVAPCLWVLTIMETGNSSCTV